MQNNSVNIQLKALISTAFPTSFSLSHADCEELRTKLVSLCDDDVQGVLGPVLIDLLDTHTNSMARPDWSDSVVRFLCAANPPPVETISGISINTKQFEEFGASRKPHAEKLFSKFTIEQARAIYHWLQAVQSWSESHIPADELAVALKYWQRRNQKCVLEK
jgi:hypothetical protein